MTPLNRVILGRLKVPLSITAFPFNRFLTWLLCHKEEVEYVRGSLKAVTPIGLDKVPGVWRGYKAELAIADKNKINYQEASSRVEEYDDVVVRYGCVPPLKTDFPLVDASWHREQQPTQLELCKEAFAFFWNARHNLKEQMMPKLKAELAPKEPVSRSEVEKQDSFSVYPVYRIRLWIDEMPPHTRSVEYSLHPEYKGITRRADRGFDQDHPFSTYVFTHDDYWVEAKLSTGAAVQGTWLTDAIVDDDGQKALGSLAQTLRGENYKEKSQMRGWPFGIEFSGDGRKIERELERAAARAAAGISD